MVHALTFFPYKFCYYSTGIRTFQQLYLGFAFFKKCGVHLFGFYSFRFITFTIQQFFKKRDCAGQFLYGDADMFNIYHAVSL